MRGHEEIERILASYRDATAEEQARANAHVASCPACAARFAAFSRIDAKLVGLAQPPLPARLAQPLSKAIALRAAQATPRRASTGSSGFAFTGSLVPAVMVLFLLVALSILMVSLESGRTPVTSTPTLTTTLTPTMISARQTEPAKLIGYAPGVAGLGHAGFPTGPGESGPTPTPAPAPVPAGGNSPVLLAGFRAHATMIH